VTFYMAPLVLSTQQAACLQSMSRKGPMYCGSVACCQCVVHSIYRFVLPWDEDSAYMKVRGLDMKVCFKGQVGT